MALAKKSKSKDSKPTYDCSRCQQCCSYPEIIITNAEIKVMAKAEKPKAMTPSQFKGKYLDRTDDKKGWQFKHKKHAIYGSICVFQMGAKGCSRYDVRPAVCHEYPGKPSCGFYDFLKEMREHTQDPDYYPTKFRV